jgi:hypothetical protein
MARGLITGETDTIEQDFGPGVGLVCMRIKRRMTYGDKDDLTHAILDFRVRKGTLMRLAESKDGMLRPDDLEDLELKTGKIALLRMNIVEWNIEDEAGNVAPLTDASFRALEPAIAEWVLSEIDLRNPKAPPIRLTPRCSTT